MAASHKSNMKMKLKDNFYELLKTELVKKEEHGPFSKTSNVMLALDLMEKGDLMSSNQVTKSNLINLVKVLCMQLEWTEETEEQVQTLETEPIEDSTDSSVTKKQMLRF